MCFTDPKPLDSFDLGVVQRRTYFSVVQYCTVKEAVRCTTSGEKQFHAPIGEDDSCYFLKRLEKGFCYEWMRH